MCAGGSHDWRVMAHAEIGLEELPPHRDTSPVITELTLRNFKAFGDTPQRLPIKPLTLIFGANSSGKSSIIQSLLLAHHGMETGDYDVHHPKLAGEMVDLGGVRTYLRKHDVTGAFKLCLEVDVNRAELAGQLERTSEEMHPFLACSHFGLCLTLGSGAHVLQELEVSINRQVVVTLSRLDSGKFKATLGDCSQNFLGAILQSVISSKVPSFGSLVQLLSDGTSDDSNTLETRAAELDLPKLGAKLKDALAASVFHFEKAVIVDPFQTKFDLLPQPEGGVSIWDDEQEERTYALSSLFNEDAEGGELWREAQVIHLNLSKLMKFCSGRIAQALQKLSYLGPLRCVPDRHLTVAGQQGSNQVASGALAWARVIADTQTRGAVNKWLGPEGLNTPYRLESRSLLDAARVFKAVQEGDASLQALLGNPDVTELVFEDTRAETTVSHRDIGFGVSQVLPVLVNACALKEQLIAIEQPELHLHPAHQAELGDVFIESALGERKNTFLLETHSEHLILRIMRRMRETHEGKLPAGLPPVRPEGVSIVFVEPGPDGSIIREMPLNERGELVKAWPGGFFEEGLREILP
jgi:hypothetical protein